MDEYAKGTGQSEARKAAAYRIVLVVAFVLMSEWVFPPLFGHRSWSFSILIFAILVFGFFTHRALRETARDLGFRMDNFAYSIRLLWPPMFFPILILVFLGYKFGSLRMPLSLSVQDIRNYLWLLWWGLLQQYVLQAIVNRQAQIIWGPGFRSICAIGLIFAALHLPNLVLMAATLAGGLIWAYVYQQAPNLFALALSHATMTVVLIWTLPHPLLHSLRVGAGYR